MKVLLSRQGKLLCYRQLSSSKPCECALPEKKRAHSPGKASTLPMSSSGSNRATWKCWKNASAPVQARSPGWSKRTWPRLNRFRRQCYRTKEARIRKYLSPKFDGKPISAFGVKQFRLLPEGCESRGAWAVIHVKGDPVSHL
ncbi:hypothetical protein [Paracoccus sp. J56]|uniref:hypothetical protein n=1 Tax=Paracoccus sp. J56 TaxID=935850 RepID=UPI001C392B97|nr:hypothetical protein [Paracoccus sp. J56]